VQLGNLALREIAEHFESDTELHSKRPSGCACSPRLRNHRIQGRQPEFLRLGLPSPSRWRRKRTRSRHRQMPGAVQKTVASDVARLGVLGKSVERLALVGPLPGAVVAGDDGVAVAGRVAGFGLQHPRARYGSVSASNPSQRMRRCATNCRPTARARPTCCAHSPECLAVLRDPSHTGETGLFEPGSIRPRRRTVRAVPVSPN
jgi:hypothetical protein